MPQHRPGIPTGPWNPQARGRSGSDVTLRIDVITLFPACSRGRWRRASRDAPRVGRRGGPCHDLREWGLGRHRSVDDYPYGGGAGMLLRPEPLPPRSRRSPRRGRAMRILLDPGASGSTRLAPSSWRREQHLVLVCPRYEGVDDRVRVDGRPGGLHRRLCAVGWRAARLVIIDAVLRLLPGAIDVASPVEESFATGLLEYPQFTRPAEYRGCRCPTCCSAGTTARSSAGAGAGARADASGAAGPAATRVLIYSATDPPEPWPRACMRAAGQAHHQRARDTRHDRSRRHRRRPDPYRLPLLASGDTVRVSAKVVEGNRERIQVFEGTVMRLRGGGSPAPSRSAHAQRRRRGAHLQGQLAAHRQDRGRATRRRPARPALLPARAGGQGRLAARAPRLVRPFPGVKLAPSSRMTATSMSMSSSVVIQFTMAGRKQTMPP